MGERLPLTFPNFEAYRDFRTQLSDCFASEGITDAVVLQVGRAVTGWEVDPAKPPDPWAVTEAPPELSLSDAVAAANPSVAASFVPASRRSPLATIA